MKRVLYIDGPFGISGDMLVAALLDMGADYEKLTKVLHSLEVKGFQTKVSRVKKSGLDMCDFLVKLDEAHENHDHDMAYLHGHEHHEHEHHHDHDHEHHHDHAHHHEHEHSHHHHHHEHRGMGEIRHIIHHSAMSEDAQKLALKIFQVLAQAEAKAHGTDVEQVYFHEVGAVDSIVDIVSIAVCMESLAIDDVVVDTLVDGHGTIRCQHGIMAVPVPAVTHIVADNGLKLRLSHVEGELVTPTGAAAAAALRTMDKLPASYRVAGVGMGAGKREYEVPTFLRLLLLEAETELSEDEILKIETNIDDSNGETLGLVQELLLSAGALDVFFTSIYMKKNRPAYMLTVLCQPQQQEAMARIIFQHTTSIGIRYEKMKRCIMQRRQLSGVVDGIAVKAKECSYGDIVRCYPEYDSIRQLQQEKGMDYQMAYELIRNHVCRNPIERK